MLGYVLGPNPPPDPAKLPYECGFEAFDDARMKFDVPTTSWPFCFILFDLEIAFLFPWAVALQDVGMTGFVAVVFPGHPGRRFCLRVEKGALDWE